MSGSAGALCRCDEPVVCPDGERLSGFVGGGLHRFALIDGRADAQDFAPRLTPRRRSAGSSLRVHETDDNRPRNPLTSDRIIGHNIDMTTTRNTSRQIRLGNTAEGGTVLIWATPATEADYIAQLRRMAPTNPAAARALARFEQA
jgi:hypothetical protein